jgi:hypothetical protein
MLTKPLFARLKQNYRTSPTQIHACTMHFPNTCAIRMSEALAATDSTFLEIFKKSKLNKCPHGYMRGAQDLGAVLSQAAVLGPRSLGWASQANGKTPNDAIGRNGIVCYMNIPGYTGQGHIDLWENDRPIGDSYWDAQTIWMWTLP